jgi:hypothetical protein
MSWQLSESTCNPTGRIASGVLSSGSVLGCQLAALQLLPQMSWVLIRPQNVLYQIDPFGMS